MKKIVLLVMLLISAFASAAEFKYFGDYEVLVEFPGRVAVDQLSLKCHPEKDVVGIYSFPGFSTEVSLFTHKESEFSFDFSLVEHGEELKVKVRALFEDADHFKGFLEINGKSFAIKGNRIR